MFPCRTLLVPAASSHSCWISFMAFSFGRLGGMPPAARVAAAPRTPAVPFHYGETAPSASGVSLLGCFFNCSLEKGGMRWCRIVLRQAHCRRLAFCHYLYRSLSTSKPVNRDSIRPKVLGRGEGEFGGGKTTGWRPPPPFFASYPLSHVHVHWALAVEELENLIHGDAAHLFEGFFGERADMRRKEHIRQGGEGHG